MSRVSLSGNPLGSGTFTIASPNSNTDRTLTLPDQTGTLLTGSGALNINASAPTNSLTLDASGNLSIGTTSSSGYRLRAVASGPAALALTSVGSSAGNPTQDWFDSTNNTEAILACSSGQIDFGAYSNHPLVFRTNNTERARIDSSGNFVWQNGSGAASTPSVNTAVMYTDSSVGRSLRFNTSFSGGQAALVFYFNSTQVGAIDIRTTSTNYATSSDYRLKNTIAPMTGALAKVAQLKPVTYKWNVDGSDGEGFIAHELAEVVPQCVTGEKDAVDTDGKPVYQGIDTSFLVATLTAAIQELKADLDATKAELAALKGQQ